MIAKIYYNDYTNNSYSGEGSYVLVNPDNYVIAQHVCSTRGWAELDLTSRIEDVLKQYDITEVYSNDKLVWKRKSTEKRFVCIVSGDGNILSIHKSFKTEQEARDFINKEFVVLFDDAELVCMSTEDLRGWYHYKEYQDIIEG